jgi:DnaJ family protein C protein 3
LIEELKDDLIRLRKEGTVPALAPNNLVARTVEMACEAYSEVCPFMKPLSN